MQRFSVDSNVFDRIAESDETVDLVRRAVDAGAIHLVATHVQQDELARIPDPVKRARVGRIPTANVLTYGSRSASPDSAWLGSPRRRLTTR